MKRDLKKWLQSEDIAKRLNISDIKEWDLEELSRRILEDADGLEVSHEDLLQFIWCEAQKQFLKDILDDIDNSIDKLFNGKDQVRNSDAQLVAYESSLKQWLYNKYHYLKRKNGN